MSTTGINMVVMAARVVSEIDMRRRSKSGAVMTQIRHARAMMGMTSSVMMRVVVVVVRVAHSVLDVGVVTLTVDRVTMVMAVTFAVGFYSNVTHDVEGGVWCFKSVVCDLQEIVILNFNGVN